MKKVIISVLVLAAVVGVICVAVFKTEAPIDPDMMHEVSEETGEIGEKIVGNPSDAKLVVYEYADFGCSHCAEWNKRINDLITKYDGKMALVYRNYDIGQFKNSAAAARAATAAQIQGYFKAYKDLLFNNQSEWYYKSGDGLKEVFYGYFEEASEGAGDLEKFKADMESEPVKKRLKFEQRLGKAANITGTPTFRIDGEKIELSELTEVIESKIGLKTY